MEVYIKIIEKLENVCWSFLKNNRFITMSVPDCYTATADDDTGEAAAGLTDSTEISA